MKCGENRSSCGEHVSTGSRNSNSGGGAGKCSVDAPLEGEATLRQLELPCSQETIYFSINIPSFSLCECVDFTHLKASVSIFTFLQPCILNKYGTVVSLNH